jgi:hypothetical protein
MTEPHIYTWTLCSDKMPPFGLKVLSWWPGDEKRNPVFKINVRSGVHQISHERWRTSRPDQEPTHWAYLNAPNLGEK